MSDDADDLDRRLRQLYDERDRIDRELRANRKARSRGDRIVGFIVYRGLIAVTVAAFALPVITIALWLLSLRNNGVPTPGGNGPQAVTNVDDQLTVYDFNQDGKVDAAFAKGTGQLQLIQQGHNTPAWQIILTASVPGALALAGTIIVSRARTPSV